MLSLPDLNTRTRWLMVEAFDEFEADATLFVPNFLTPEGREDYSSIFRVAVHQRDEEWLATHLLDEGFVAASEAPGRAGGAAARPVSPQVIQALVRGEFNRLYCLALCRAAAEDKIPELQVFRAEGVGNSTSEVARHEGQMVPVRELLDSLRTDTLDAFLGLPHEHRQGVLSVRLPAPK